MWSSCKRMLREERTIHSKLITTYLPGGDVLEALHNLLLHIADQYPQLVEDTVIYLV